MLHFNEMMVTSAQY